MDTVILQRIPVTYYSVCHTPPRLGESMRNAFYNSEIRVNVARHRLPLIVNIKGLPNPKTFQGAH